jgi:hypothetical protein
MEIKWLLFLCNGIYEGWRATEINQAERGGQKQKKSLRNTA